MLGSCSDMVSRRGVYSGVGLIQIIGHVDGRLQRLLVPPESGLAGAASMRKIACLEPAPQIVNGTVSVGSADSGTTAVRTHDGSPLFVHFGIDCVTHAVAH